MYQEIFEWYSLGSERFNTRDDLATFHDFARPCGFDGVIHPLVSVHTLAKSKSQTPEAVAFKEMYNSLVHNAMYSFTHEDIPKVSGHFVYYTETSKGIAKVGKHSGTLGKLVSRHGNLFPDQNVVVFDCDGYDYTIVEKAVLDEFKDLGLSTVREQVEPGKSQVFSAIVRGYFKTTPRTEISGKKAYQFLTREYTDIPVQETAQMLLTQNVGENQSHRKKFSPFKLQIRGKRYEDGGETYILTPVTTRSLPEHWDISRYCKNSKTPHPVPCVYFTMTKHGITHRCNSERTDGIYCACKDLRGDTWKLPEGLHNHFFKEKQPKAKKRRSDFELFRNWGII